MVPRGSKYLIFQVSESKFYMAFETGDLKYCVLEPSGVPSNPV